MLAEFEDEKTGLSALDELENEMKAGNYAPDETQQKLIEIVSNVLLTRQRQPKSFDSTEFAESDKEFLVEHLGWLGRLLLTPKFAQDQDQRKKLVDSAIMSTVTISLITLPAVLFGLAGILLAILAIRLYLMNALKVGIPDNVRSGTVYLETFTLWLLAFFGVQIATGIVFHTLAQGAPDTPTMTTARMLAGPIITFGSLLVLVWPVLRGKKFSEVRDDIGWRFSRPWTEGFMGILGYCAGMPMLVASFFVVLLLFVLTTLSSQPVSEFAGIPQVQQPIQELLGDGNVFAIIVAFFAACICAPIVEETMFRGVFYRYLRDQTSGIGRIASVIVSALLNGVIFAAIHPQGLVALPALTCLAVTFSFLRQWRGSLLAPMFVHGMHNGFLVLTLIALM